MDDTHQLRSGGRGEGEGEGGRDEARQQNLAVCFGDVIQDDEQIYRVVWNWGESLLPAKGGWMTLLRTLILCAEKCTK